MKGKNAVMQTCFSPPRRKATVAPENSDKAFGEGSAMFDYSTLFRSNAPAPAAGRFAGFPPYNFVGGHNDPEGVPVQELTEAVSRAMQREGRDLATYGMQSGPQGYRPLREQIAKILGGRAGMKCDADDVLVVSGSLQALDLVNSAFVEPGDTVLVEAQCYAGALGRLRTLGARMVPLEQDEDGILLDHLETVLSGLKAEGVRPKFLYTIPTVQNPTGSIMSLERRKGLLEITGRYGVPIFEDDCYADLVWDGERPPALHALDETGSVIYCGSFSKSIAPAFRVGFVVAPWPVMAQLLSLKTDAGSGAVEQLMLAEYLPGRFDGHVAQMTERLHKKAVCIADALAENFGAAAEFTMPRGGIFIWVTLPPEVDTGKLFQAASQEGVHLNPGSEWSADPETGRNRMRLCFGNPDEQTIRDGIARLADICHREFGVPVRSGNVARG